MYQTMDWKKSFQVEISPLASYAGEGLDKYKGTTLTAPCSINKVTLLVIFVSDVGCLFNIVTYWWFDEYFQEDMQNGTS